MNIRYLILIGCVCKVHIIPSDLLDNYHLQNLIETFLFIGNYFSNKSNKNFKNCKIYKKEKITDSNSLYIYFHGNAEFVDNIHTAPFINSINRDNVDYIIYEYPGYFYTKNKYKKSNIDNFISYSKKIAEDIIKSGKTEIYIVSWSLGVWVSLLVLRNLKRYIIKKNIKIKVVLLNGFYDLYQIIDDFGGLKLNYGFMSFMYKIIISRLLKKLINRNINNIMSNFYLLKYISDIADIKYMIQVATGHDGIFWNTNDERKINKFLNTPNHKNVEIIITSANNDIITGEGMLKAFNDLKNKNLHNPSLVNRINKSFKIFNID